MKSMRRLKLVLLVENWRLSLGKCAYHCTSFCAVFENPPSLAGDQLAGASFNGMSVKFASSPDCLSPSQSVSNIPVCFVVTSLFLQVSPQNWDGCYRNPANIHWKVKSTRTSVPVLIRNLCKHFLSNRSRPDKCVKPLWPGVKATVSQSDASASSSAGYFGRQATSELPRA